MYYKENLPIKERRDLETLDETIERKEIFFVLSYRHPNQSRDEMNVHMEALQNIHEKIKTEKPAADYNSKSSLFGENVIENWEGRIFSKFLISNNLGVLINEPTHIPDDGTQTCIDLICIDPHSKHSIIHGKLYFNFPSPHPYKRKVWGLQVCENQFNSWRIKYKLERFILQSKFKWNVLTLHWYIFRNYV